MSYPPGGFRRPPNPVTQAAFRRQVRLEIYLPLGLTILAVVVLIAVAIALPYGTASSWADVSLVVLAVPMALLLLLLTAALGGLFYLMVIMIREIPPLSSGLQERADQVAAAAQRGSDVAVQPILIPSGLAAGLAEAVRALRSIFRADEVEP
jgi:hypothetical protein